MPKMVAKKALELLTQSVSDIVGDESQVAAALSRALYTGRTIDLAFARQRFDQMDRYTRREVQGHAESLAKSYSVH